MKVKIVKINNQQKVQIMKKSFKFIALIISIMMVFVLMNCQQGGNGGAIGKSAADRAFVPPGEYDTHYAFISGGFSGQLAIHGLPSGRLFKVIPVFSVDGEKAWGFNEETKPMLETSFGFIPWDDSHHPDLSQTNGKIDGRWCFINANNTPRVARISLQTFETEETDGESLLVAFLSELVYYAEQGNMGFDDFVIEIKNDTLKVEMQGAPLQSLSKVIKAVTWHKLEIHESARGLEVEIVFDV